MAAFAAILAVPFAFASLILGLSPLGFDFEALGDPAVMLATGHSGAQMFGWSMLTDIFGYYLLMVPPALLLHARLRPRHPVLVDLATMAGVAYSLLGTIGAAFLYQAWPTLITSYAGAGAAQQEVLHLIFRTLSAGVEDGIWTIGGGLGGLWWLGIGTVLRSEERALGWATIVLGALTIVASLSLMLGLTTLAEGPLLAYLLGAPLWALWLGTRLLQGRSTLRLHPTT